MSYVETLASLRDMKTDFGIGIVYGQSQVNANLERYEHAAIRNITFALLRGVAA